MRNKVGINILFTQIYPRFIYLFDPLRVGHSRANHYAYSILINNSQIKLAVFPPIAAVLLPRLMPPARAMEVLLGGENFTAEEGLALGLINRVFARASFAADVQAFLAPFLKLSRVALLSTRRALREADGKPFAAALDSVEHIYRKELMQTDDAKEGLAAFLEKRKPKWVE